jgi:hypothetical protein
MATSNAIPRTRLNASLDANLSGYDRITLVKNPHAVALGRLGGAKGGHARARVLTSRRRQEIAKAAGLARTRALSPTERQGLARRAAEVRWAPRTIVTAAEAPGSVRRLLKTYDPGMLKWANKDDRYAVVREILVRGNDEARTWLRLMLRRRDIRDLVRTYAAAGCSEPERVQLRRDLRLSRRDIPGRAFLGFFR